MENENNQKRCPKCSKENPDDARYCNACGCELRYQRLDVKISKSAIASFVCALFALGCFIPGLFAAMEPRLLDPQSDMVQNIACVSIWAGGIAVLLGVIALALIGLSGGRSTGYGFAVIGAAIPPILIGVLFWYNIGRWGTTISKSMICATNLSGLGKAMLVYSKDYDDAFPSAGEHNGQWVARTPWWAADNRKDAYGLSDPNDTDGRASVSASMYLLVKYAEATPKTFVCPGDVGTTEFQLSDYGACFGELIDFWDFGSNPPRHCSYSYHVPYGGYALTNECDPGLAVMADRNPWMDSPFKIARDFQAFDPDENRETVKAGNTVTHKTDGQIVLFLDGHVGFEKQSFCGLNEDNIYTSWNGEDKRRGTPPRLGSKPANRMDSLLVNDPAIPK